MKTPLVKLKMISLWLIAILLTAFQPVESIESVKEIEETQEVKLYCESREKAEQKPAQENSKQKIAYLKTSYDYRRSVYSNLPPRYILYQHLIYYE